MYPSFAFWVDTLVSLVAGLGALSLLWLVPGVGLRQRLTRTFIWFAICAALLGLGSAIANMILLLDSLSIEQNLNFGNPLFWFELASVGFYFVGPALLGFAVTYVKTEARWYNWMIIGGVLLGGILLPLFFSHQLVERVYLDKAGVAFWKVTPLGYVAVGIPFVFEALALSLFWRHRQYLSSAKLAVGISILLVGGILGSLLSIPFPVINSTFAVGVLTLNYVVTGEQIFNPLQSLTAKLETTVRERTQELESATDKLQHLNAQQQRIAELNQDIARLTSPDEMAEALVELLHDRFGYHHVYVYQCDESYQYLELWAAAGSAALLLDRKHRLVVGGHSLAGQVALARRPRLAQAQGEDAFYFENTALPGARTEMALPLLVGDRLLGVLDLQSAHMWDFSEKDLRVLTDLANQCAVTLDNARLLQETETALEELAQVQRQDVRRAWQSFLGQASKSPAYVYTDEDGVEMARLEKVWSTAMAQAMTARQPLVSGQTEHPASTLSLPIMLRGQVIGVLELQHKEGLAWQPEDVETMGRVVERLGLALETARLSEETQRRIARERFIRNVSDKMQRATDVASLMRVTAEALNEALGATQTYVRMTAEKPPVCEDDVLPMVQQSHQPGRAKGGEG